MPAPAFSNTATRSPAAEAVAAALIAFALLFSGTSRVPIINGDEARFAQASREMLASRDVIVPTFGGRDRYDKPPVIYWLTAASLAVFGTTSRAARLPSNAAAILTVALTAWWVRRRAGPGSGLLAGTLLAVTPVFLVQGRSCTADAVTVALTLVAMLSLEPIVRGDGRLCHAVVLWTASAFAVLTKGPVAPVVLAATGLGLWALARRWRTGELIAAGGLVIVGAVVGSPLVLLPLLIAAGLSARADPVVRARLRDLRWGLGALIMTVVVLPWAAAAWAATDGDFVRIAVGRHVLERGLSPLEGHAGFPGFYVATALVLGFPWFGALLAAIADAWRGRHDEPVSRFLLAWVLGPVAVLEVLATKLVHYPMALYPAAVLLVTLWAWRERSRPPGPAAVIIHAVGGLLLASVPVVVAEVANMPELRPAAIVAAVILVAGVAVSTTRLRTNPRSSLAASAVATALSMTVLMNVFVPRLGAELLGPRLIARAVEARGPDDALVVYGLRDEEVLFHGPADLGVCRTADELASWLTAHPSSVGLSRLDRLQAFLEAQPQWRPVLLDPVAGYDLGRGRAAEGVVFRLEASR